MIFKNIDYFSLAVFLSSDWRFRFPVEEGDLPEIPQQYLCDKY